MLITLSPKRRHGPADLVDLLGECHDRIRRFAALARQAATRRDAPSAEVVQACVDVERYFLEALPLHVADEEESIEPRLRGLSPPVDRALDAMEEEHRRHGPMLQALLRATARVRRAPDDDAARSELATAAEGLEREFGEHLALEESVVFPAIRELLSQETQRCVVDELRRRRNFERPHTNQGTRSNVLQED